jgi:hypothetical protein
MSTTKVAPAHCQNEYPDRYGFNGKQLEIYETKPFLFIRLILLVNENSVIAANTTMTQEITVKNPI